MPFSLFLALRYLKPRGTFVSVITLLSVIGVSLGVAVLMFVIAVMAGFQKRITEALLSFEPHLMVMDHVGPREDENGFTIDNDWREVLEIAKSVPGVVDVSPVVEQGVIAVKDDEAFFAMMRAIEPEGDALLGNISAEQVIEGEFDLTGDGAAVSYMLAQNRGIEVGDTVRVYSEESLRDVVKLLQELEREPENAALKEKLEKVFDDDVVLPKEVTVRGIIDASKEGYYLLLPLQAGLDLYELGDSVPGITVRAEDPYQIHSLQMAFDAALEGRPWGTVTWADRHQSALDAVRMERSMMYGVLFVIMIVAAFCIMNTMITVTVQKRHEIGVIGAVGAKVNQIVWVFLLQGMVVGVLGVISGLGLGSLLLYYREEVRNMIAFVTGFEILSPSVYGAEALRIPAIVLPGDLLNICGGAFVLCSLAALLPAYFAARIDPAKALRNV